MSGPEPDVDLDRSVDDRDGLLAHGAESTLSQFLSEHRMLDRFQQAAPEGGVDAKGGIYDLFGESVLRRAGFL